MLREHSPDNVMVQSKGCRDGANWPLVHEAVTQNDGFDTWLNAFHVNAPSTLRVYPWARETAPSLA